MNNSTFIFQLNKNSSISLEISQYPEDYPYCFYEDHFFLNHNYEKFQLSYFLIASNIEKLIIHLKKCLNNQKNLPENLSQDVGYLWNLYINADNDPQLEYANIDYEFLDNFDLWYSTFTTWIYNDQEGNIFLEITPSYPHTFSANFSYQDFLTWMQNYKPLFKTILPRKIAEQWLIQAQQILDTIDENTQTLHEQGKL
ncbi:hypothetical protein KBC04_05515 [Candidatus Babeliales bacterium]|nr:hypothetical protein [Candidatus Babeliales bacterium]MBP9844395.1 hypothetical protein [Candidatus Babeliales bacterium]